MVTATERRWRVRTRTWWQTHGGDVCMVVIVLALLAIFVGVVTALQ